MKYILTFTRILLLSNHTNTKGNKMITKTFTAWNGDKELTREQYIQEWLDSTIAVGGLFDGKMGDVTSQQYFAFRDTVADLAGKKWDKQ